MEGVLTESDFKPLEFGRRNISQQGNRYRVFRSASDYTEVEADSAFDAMTRSQIQKPFKISRYMVNYLSVLSQDMLVQQKSEMAQEIALNLPDDTQAELADGNSAGDA